MDYPIHIDTISMELSILCFKVLMIRISIYNSVFLSLKIVFILANSADPDEYHRGVHCLSKYLCIQNEKDYFFLYG